MGRANQVNKKDKPTKAVRQPKTANSGAGIAEEQADNLGHRMSTIISVVAIVGALVCLVFFFSSDIPNKIVTSKVKSAQAAQSHTPDKPVADADENDDSKDSDTSNNTFHIAVMPGADIDKQSVIDYLTNMNEDEFNAFVDTFTKKAELSDVDTEAVRSFYTSVLQGELTGKGNIIAALDSMNDAEFQVLMKSVIKAISPEQLANLGDVKVTGDSESSNASDVTETEGPLKTTLEEAYAEAEARYPGQIDGSKRLKLIQDLNATDYLYYVAEQGDTLLKLSQAFNVPLGQLVELNGIHDADKIKAGAILLFPSDTEQPDIDSDNQ